MAHPAIESLGIIKEERENIYKSIKATHHLKYKN